MAFDTWTGGTGVVNFTGGGAIMSAPASGDSCGAWTPADADLPESMDGGEILIGRVDDAGGAADRQWDYYVYNRTYASSGNPPQRWLFFGFRHTASDGKLRAIYYDADLGEVELAELTYDPDAHKWMRMRKVAGHILFDVSADPAGPGWTQVADLDGTVGVDYAFSALAFELDFLSGTHGGATEIGWGHLEFDGNVLLHAAGFADLTAIMGAASGLDATLFLELPSRISGDFTTRWGSGLHIGDAKPNIRVQVRRGRFNRARRSWPGTLNDPTDTVGISIAGIDMSKPWQATWTPAEPYVDVPNVLSFERGQSFDQKGLSTAKLVVENIMAVAEPEGHHTLHRGYLAPARGYVGPGRTTLVDERGDDVVPNEWYDTLRRNAQITVTIGYGDEVVKTFTGLVDDVDTTSDPDRMTITLRCFGGKVLGDTRMFGWSKDPKIIDPVVFIDAEDAEDVESVALSTASSGNFSSQYAPDNVTDSDSGTSWRSNSHGTENFTEWVEITLPEGRYSNIVLNPEWAHQEIYVSVFPTNQAGAVAPSRNDVPITPDDWYDAGLGDVPGASGGIPYVFHIADVSGDRQSVSLGGSFKMGAGSKIRVSVRELHEVTSGVFVAGITALVGRRRTLSESAVTQKWVRVGDVADIVKCILRWAGFKEWEVETTGVPLRKRFVANRGMTYMDVIDACCEAVGYEFFVADPTSDDRSLGVPIFRQSRIVTDDAPILTVTDNLLLEDVAAHTTDEPLAYIIRVRGRESKEGVKLGADRTKRLQFTLRPPWSGVVHSDEWDKNGGIHKRVIQTNNMFKTMDDCRFGAYFIALKEAIASTSATVQVPTHPAVQLDHHVEMRDLGTGLTTRLSVRERRDTYQGGEETFWQSTFIGALVDIEWVQDVVALINAATRSDV